MIDDDDSGGIGYEEFVDHLARGTVTPAAMGKRGMQSKEAMGVDGQAWIDDSKQRGHRKEKDAPAPSVSHTVNAGGGGGYADLAAVRGDHRRPPPSRGAASVASSAAGPGQPPMQTYSKPRGRHSSGGPAAGRGAAAALAAAEGARRSSSNAFAQPPPAGSVSSSEHFAEPPRPPPPHARKPPPPPSSGMPLSRSMAAFEPGASFNGGDTSAPPMGSDTLDELRKAIEGAVHAKHESASKAFVKIAKKKPNKVTAAELHAAVNGWGIAASQAQVAALIERCDDNGNGLMDFEEFSNHIMKTDAQMGKSRS